MPGWRGFLCAARDAFAADHAALILGTDRPGGDAVLIGDEDPWLDAAEALHRTGLCDGLPIGSALVRDAGPDGHALILPLADDEGRPVHVLLWRSAAREAFDDDARARLDRLATPLDRAIRLFERIVTLERRQIVANAAIETAGIGVILVSAEGEALLTNTIADEMLAAGDGLHLSHGRLRALTPADTATLLDHVRAKAAEQQAEPDWQVYAPLALPRADHPLPLTVIVRPGPPFRPLRNPLVRTAMLVLRDPARRPVIPGATLGRLFGLTPAEALLASELARGASLDEAADQLGIRRNTARTQLQAVFAKTGVNRQGELVRVLLSSAAALSR